VKLVSDRDLKPSPPVRQVGALTTRNSRSVGHRFVFAKEVVRDNVSSEKYGKM